MTSNTLCKFAWSAATSTMIDTFRPCCRFPFDDNSQYPTTDEIIFKGQTAFDNNFLVQLRKDMLEGKTRNECRKCYIEERSNIISMRQKGNERFTASMKDYNFEKLEFLEISMDNLCNLECRMCNSRFSTKLKNRDKLLFENGLEEYFSNQVKFKTLEIMDALDLANLKMIKMLGGEPLISPNLLLFLNKIPHPENVDLLIITNSTTIPPNDVIDKLKTFKSVRFDFSIDGIFQYNDYQRVGSNFETLISNSLFLAQHFKQEHTIHAVFSSLNIFGLNASIEWFEKHMPFSLTVDIVSNNILSPFISPESYKEEILKSLKDSNSQKKYVTNLFNTIHKHNENKWNDFIKFCKLTDNLYGTDIGEINPILKKIIVTQE